MTARILALAQSAIFLTLVIVSVAAVVSHLLLMLIWKGPGNFANFPWAPIIGVTLALVSIVTFGGFYLASRRLRVAIAGAFVLTYLVSLSYSAEVPQNFTSELFKNFITQVTTVVAFYFGSEAVIGVGKATAISKIPNPDAAAVRSSDRDLVTPSPATSPAAASEAIPPPDAPASTS